MLNRNWTEILTTSEDDGSTPNPRYHHASVLLTGLKSSSGGHEAGHSLMLVVGGVTPEGVAMDTWSLNLSSLVWKEYKVSVRHEIKSN